MHTKVFKFTVYSRNLVKYLHRYSRLTSYIVHFLIVQGNEIKQFTLVITFSVI